MRTMTVILLVMLLAACACKPVEKVVTVTKVVNVPCTIAAPARPAFAYRELAPEDFARLDPQVKALLIEREQRQAYEGELEAAIKACQ